jgi:hypothetical protein
MKLKFTLLYLLLFAFASGAQEITGVWKGYFVQNTFGYYQDRYKFEVQIEQLGNSAINGITYSYKTTVFYGKASLTGFYTKKTNVLTISETKLLEVKIDGESQPCIMTCYLEYAKTGNMETLTGTYTSKNLKDKTDCGNGKVYLEKSLASDFYKEDFLIKREIELRKKQEAKPEKKALAAKPSGAKPSLQNKPLALNRTTPKATPPKSSLSTNKATPRNNTAGKPAIKPGAEDNLMVESDKKKVATPSVAVPQKDEHIKVPKVTQKPLPKPEVIRKRSNELVKTFHISAKEIKIDLYDNGEIDGDTISVYHNNQLIVSRKMLTNKPISFTIKADENTPIHEFVMVAENLGSIPPNTALMVITAGSKRYELFVTSTEQKNAVVAIEYKPESE